MLDQLREARQDFLAAIEGLPDDAMLRVGAAGVWSVKDVMAHLTAWEAELVTALNRKLGRKYDQAPQIAVIEDIDEWNAEQYHLSVRRPLAVILEDFHGVHKYLLQAVEDLDERALEKPMFFEWMEGEPLSYLILETAVWHEQEHAADIRQWREDQGL